MLKFQYFGHLMRKADSLEKTLMLGTIEGRRRRGRQRIRWLDSMSGHSEDMKLSKSWEIVKDGGAWVLQFMGLQIVGHDLMTEQHSFLKILVRVQGPVPGKCPLVVTLAEGKSGLLRKNVLRNSFSGAESFAPLLSFAHTLYAVWKAHCAVRFRGAGV